MNEPRNASVGCAIWQLIEAPWLMILSHLQIQIQIQIQIVTFSYKMIAFE